MSSDKDLLNALKKATEQEKRYEWLEAAKSYEQTLHPKSQTVTSEAETWEKIGFSYSQASKQTDNIEEFKRLRQNAIEAYKNAAQLFEKEDNPRNKGKMHNATPLQNIYALGWHPVPQGK